VAAENAALAGGKMGGIGDVIRDLPAALADLGLQITVLTPSYGSLQKLPGARALGSLQSNFRGINQEVDVWEVHGAAGTVRSLVLDHNLFMPTEPGVIYHSDGDDRPFATDANKFAFFCAGVACWVETLESTPAAIHLHDWHAGTVAVLRAFEPRFECLRQTPIVLTIHNLAYQGQRPFTGDPSSLKEWFPGLDYTPEQITDPVFDCYNPMAAAIRLADRINTVSPTYAKEILRKSDPERGFVGGEGLEDDLNRAAEQGRLTGILNGCDYSMPRTRPAPWGKFLKLAKTTVGAWKAEADARVHRLALERLSQLPRRRPPHVLTSVGRVVEQKMRLLLEPDNDGVTALEAVLDRLGSRGHFFLLGNGEPRYEGRLEAIAADRENMTYFRGYSEALGDELYRTGDLFLMPSSFEPCGISQLRAMREGQPCVVHGVGGLADTVEDGVSGFVFRGDTAQEQSAAFVECVGNALTLRDRHPRQWRRLREQAAGQRFEWSASALQYIETIYERL